MDRPDFALMLKPCGCDQLSERAHHGAVIIRNAHSLVLAHARAATARILGRDASRAAVGVAAQRLDAAQCKHEAARGIAPVRAKRHRPRYVESSRDLA